jgi:hypothetical protein
MRPTFAILSGMREDPPYLEVIAAFPGPNPDDMPTYVLRNLDVQALAELGADLAAAQARGDSIEPLLACWAVVNG